MRRGSEHVGLMQVINRMSTNYRKSIGSRLDFPIHKGILVTPTPKLRILPPSDDC